MLGVLLLLTLPAAKSMTVVVHAGDVDRVNTPVWLDVKAAGIPKLGAWVANVSAEGIAVPAQVENSPAGPHSRVSWVVDRLAKGQTRAYDLRMDIKADVSPGSTGKSPFQWTDSRGVAMDLVYEGKPLLRYMYQEVDPTDKDGIRKPYHHVFDAARETLITKGAGGLYTHHRGIFFGYNKCGVGGATWDTWHCVKGKAFQRHRDVAENVKHKPILGDLFGGHTVLVDWNDKDGKPFARDARRLIAYRPLGGTQIIDFDTRLEALSAPVKLAGDRQHAGVQFRASQEVADNQAKTRYLRPAAWAKLPADKEQNGADFRDLPWNAVQFSLGGVPYTVAYLSHPANLNGAEFSERLYGRFGEFIPTQIAPDKPLQLAYRIVVIPNEKVSRDFLEDRYQDYANPPRLELK